MFGLFLYVCVYQLVARECRDFSAGGTLRGGYSERFCEIGEANSIEFIYWCGEFWTKFYAVV